LAKLRVGLEQLRTGGSQAVLKVEARLKKVAALLEASNVRNLLELEVDDVSFHFDGVLAVKRILLVQDEVQAAAESPDVDFV